MGYNTYSLIKNMSKDMTSKEKLFFIASFVWAMHWGVRVAFATISTLELRYF